MATKSPSQNKNANRLTVVGIGASAGGIEAISEMIANLRSGMGLVYVIIQHLAPEHASMLADLIKKKTSIPVLNILDGMRLESDHIYVIPPNAFLSVNNGTFELKPRKKTNGVFYGIDYFFSSLAAAYQHNAVGVILSGVGSDGTIGLKSIKSEGGITFAQDDSAQYQGMPHSAIDAGWVDFTLPPDKIAYELGELAKNANTITNVLPADIQQSEGELKKILILLNNAKGVDFAYYKKNTIYRRITRRMVLNRLHQLPEYTRFLRGNSREIELLYKDLLINVTTFFRDESVFEALKTKVFPALLKEKKAGEMIRIWVPGCSMGEEACSIAISLLEYLGQQTANYPVQIFATDLNEASIDRARQGIYPPSVLKNVSEQRLKRFFVKLDGNYQVAKSVREICIFAPHNLLKDPPFSHIDVVSCQNVFIYLEPHPQKKVLQAFHYSLKNSGFLILGKAESIGSSDELFFQFDKEQKIYQKKLVKTLLNFDFSLRKPYTENLTKENNPSHTGEDNGFDIEKETNKLLLSRYVPASITVNKNLEILSFRGPVSRYLAPSSGKASLNLMKMIRDELIFELRSLLTKAKKEDKVVNRESLILPVNDHSLEVNIEVAPVKAEGAQYYLIIFRENALIPLDESPKEKEGKLEGKDKRIETLERELKDALLQIKAVSEEFEATREELQSANEEVISSNEELQSINEELETSKEELQSVNEELITINEELQLRNGELKEAANYNRAIIQTIREPLIVLNENLKVRTANRAFYDLFKEKPEKIEGNYLFEAGDRTWDIQELRDRLHKLVSSKDTFVDFEIRQKFPAIGFRILNISLYQLVQENNSSNDRILITIQDITSRTISEEKIRESEELFRQMADNSPMKIWISDLEGRRTYFNQTWLAFTGRTMAEEKDHGWEADVRKRDLKHCQKVYKDAFEKKGKFKLEYRLRRYDGVYRWVFEQGAPMHTAGKITGFITSAIDITEHVELERRKDEFIAVASHELKTPVTSIKAYAEMLQQDFSESEDGEAVELLKKMEAQADRLNLLIKDLMDVTKLAMGKIELKKDYFDINELVGEVAEQIQTANTGYQIIKELEPSPKIYADRERISQVLNNLLSNAIKYSPDTDKIIIKTINNSQNIQVSIQDFGIGINEEALEKIFERFFRTTESADIFPGLGLGLYIASEIVKHHHGKIYAKSKIKEGATFYFTLPFEANNNNESQLEPKENFRED